MFLRGPQHRHAGSSSRAVERKPVSQSRPHTAFCHCRSKSPQSHRSLPLQFTCYTLRNCLPASKRVWRSYTHSISQSVTVQREESVKQTLPTRNTAAYPIHLNIYPGRRGNVYIYMAKQHSADTADALWQLPCTSELIGVTNREEPAPSFSRENTCQCLSTSPTRCDVPAYTQSGTVCLPNFTRGVRSIE